MSLGRGKSGVAAASAGLVSTAGPRPQPIADASRVHHLVVERGGAVSKNPKQDSRPSLAQIVGIFVSISELHIGIIH